MSDIFVLFRLRMGSQHDKSRGESEPFSLTVSIG